MRKCLHILWLVGLFGLLGCGNRENPPYTYYYWRTVFRLDETEKKALEAAPLEPFYVRYFDVDKVDGQAQALAPIIVKENKVPNGKIVVPTVFITNRTFFGVSEGEAASLAAWTFQQIKQRQVSFGGGAFPEIQIDCDWTASTRDNFFFFLKELKRISSVKVSSTLRLHQVRDRKVMGVPPVDKVYLMCYSTSSPLEATERNSILDVALLKNYLASVDRYPVKNMDIALPIYSWGIVTNHLGRHKLINALKVNDLYAEGLRKTSADEAVVTRDGFYFGYFLNKGFKIKVEEVSEEQLAEVTAFLNRKLGSYRVVYYHLDHEFINNRIK
ncbi:hypothetical protein [Bergeyella sp. RCAD1439]|uniref:hypothetical protein n=1 Tax=Bergeyella anatis TaxID=3113737 RepID=UPI002E199B47|nr:hypothetical protein [Bergeyella sp. RCAD1439]